MKRVNCGFILIIMLLPLIINGCVLKGKNEEKEIQNQSQKSKYHIVCGIGLNDKSASFKSLQYFKQIIEERSNGELTMDNYHSAEIGDDREMIEALQQGYLEMTAPSSAPIVPFIPDFNVFDAPFLFPDYESADKVLDGPIGQELLDRLSDVGIKGLVYWENGYRHLTNNIRPVDTPSDVKDLKIRTMENAIHLETWRQLGARPTQMVFSELYSAMQQKVVDGQENPFSTIYLQNYFEVQRYLTNTAHVYTPFVLMMSQEFWDDLPSHLKEIVMEAAVETRTHNRELNRKMDKEYFELLKGKMQVTELSSWQREKFKKEVVDVFDYYKDFNPDLIKSVQFQINEN